MVTDPNDQAFPDDSRHYGLSKREYFVGLAFQGLLASCANLGSPVDMATSAIGYADQLIDSLNEAEGETNE